jgi:hypothetical protein
LTALVAPDIENASYEVLHPNVDRQEEIFEGDNQNFGEQDFSFVPEINRILLDGEFN